MDISTCTRLIKAIIDNRNHCRSVDSLASSRAVSDIERIKLLMSFGDNATLLDSKATIIKALAYKRYRGSIRN